MCYAATRCAIRAASGHRLLLSRHRDAGDRQQRRRHRPSGELSRRFGPEHFPNVRKISRVRGRPFGDLDVELARQRGRRRWAGRKPKMSRDADEAMVQLDSLCLRWGRWYEQISELRLLTTPRRSTSTRNMLRLISALAWPTRRRATSWRRRKTMHRLRISNVKSNSDRSGGTSD
jgi:hypothetical protein